LQQDSPIIEGVFLKIIVCENNKKPKKEGYELVPVEFLSEEQTRRYGRYVGEPSDEQLARYFHLDDADSALIGRRRGDHNRLGFAVQLGTVRFLGTFLDDPTDVPGTVVAYTARQLGIADPGCLERYGGASETHWDHAAEIKRGYGYRNFGEPPEYFRLIRWLYTRAWLSAERPSFLFDLATARLVERKILLPGVTVLERLVSRVRAQAERRLWRSLVALPDPAQRSRLEGLLKTPEGDRQSSLDRLRHGPHRISGPALIHALQRLREIRELGVSNIDLGPFPPNRIQILARYAIKTKAPMISRMPDDRRISALLAFAKTFEVTALDDALDVLDRLITDILKAARRLGEKERLRTLRDLDKAALDLQRACEMLLDESLPADKLRERVFSRIPKERLQQASNRVAELARPTDDRYQQEIMKSYIRVRRFLPTLLRTVNFHGTPAGQPVVRALAFLALREGKRNPEMSEAPLEGISPAWKRWIIDANGRIDRRAYTLCVLERLQEDLRRRDVFVLRSERWGDPRQKLLHGSQWTRLKRRVCRSLGHQETSEQAIEELSRQLDEAYRQTLSGLPANAAVRLNPANSDNPLSLSPLDKLDEPASLIELREQVAARLPRVDLPEVLLEIHAHTGFADAFTHISEDNARAVDLPISLCAALLAEACNIGLEPLVRPDHPALTRHRLSWVQQNYIRAETLIRANARLVDYQLTIPLARQWGGGEVASADSLRFVTSVRTVNAGPNTISLNICML
jgi:hypothetical protein